MNSTFFITHGYHIVSFLFFLSLVIFAFLKKIAPLLQKNMETLETHKASLREKDSYLTDLKIKTIKDFENQKQYFQYLESKILLWNEAVLRKTAIGKEEQLLASDRIKEYTVRQSEVATVKALYKEVVPQAIDQAVHKIKDFFKKKDAQSDFAKKAFMHFIKDKP